MSSEWNIRNTFKLLWITNFLCISFQPQQGYIERLRLQELWALCLLQAGRRTVGNSLDIKSQSLNPLSCNNLVSILGFWPNFSSSNFMHSKHPIQVQYWREGCVFPDTNCSVTCRYIIKQLSHYFLRAGAINDRNKGSLHAHAILKHSSKPHSPQPCRSEIPTYLTDMTESTNIAIREWQNTHYSSCFWTLPQETQPAVEFIKRCHSPELLLKISIIINFRKKILPL